MKILETTAQIAEAMSRVHCGDAKVGFASALGAIHEGHETILRRAREMSDTVVMMVYANPLVVEDPEIRAQFAASRSRDIEALQRYQVDYAYFPAPDELLASGQKTTVSLAKLGERFRNIESEQYLTGLATVHFQAMNLFHPAFIFVGQKNYLDYHLLKRLCRDFHLYTEIVLCPVVRDENGLPYTSFNPYFDESERQAIRMVYRALQEAREALMAGETAPARLQQQIQATLAAAPNFKPRYLGVLDPASMNHLEKVGQEALIYIVGQAGRFRITDNIIFRKQTS